MTSKNQKKPKATISPLNAAGDGLTLERSPISHRSCSFLYATVGVPRIMVGLKTLLFLMLAWSSPGMAGEATSLPVTAGAGETVIIADGTTGTLDSGPAITASDGGIVSGANVGVTVTGGAEPAVVSTGTGSFVALTDATIASPFIGVEMRDGGWADVAGSAINMDGRDLPDGSLGVYIFGSAPPAEGGVISNLTININDATRTTAYAWMGVLAESSGSEDNPVIFDSLKIGVAEDGAAKENGVNLGVASAKGAFLTVDNSDIAVKGLINGSDLLVGQLQKNRSFIGVIGMGLLAFSDATLTATNTNVTLETADGAADQGAAYGIYAIEGSTINITGGSITMKGDGSSDYDENYRVGIYAVDHSTGTVSGTKVDMSGNENIGIWAEEWSSLKVDGVEVLTNGEYSYAMRVETRAPDSLASITLTNGTLKSTGDYSYGIAAIGPGSTFTDLGSTITTDEGNDSVAVWVDEGARVELTDSIVNANGNKNLGAWLTGDSSTLIMTNVTMTSSDQGVLLDGPEAAVSMTGGTLTSASAAFVVTDVDGVLDIDSGALVQSDANTLLYVAANDDIAGSVTLTASNGSTLFGDMKAQERAIATVNLDSQTAWTGAAINIGDFSMTGDSLWNMTGNSDVASLLLDNSVIVSSEPTDGEFKTLTVHGNYEGRNGVISLNTYLGGDDSPSDRLIVEGSTSGQTGLVIVNAGGPGVQTTGEGIEVVEVAGESTGEFALAGRAVAGIYEYHLYRGSTSDTNSNWYLRNTILAPDGTEIPDIRPEVPLAGAIAMLASDHGFAMLDTLHERVGELFPPAGEQVCDGGRCAAVWARLLGSRFHNTRGSFMQDGPRYKYTMKGAQIGWDVLARQGRDGNDDSAGFYLGYARTSSDVDGIRAGKAGTVHLDGYSLGLYWTHRGVEPWYTDLVVQGSLYRAKANSIYGERIKPHGNGLLASLESGYAFQLTQGLNLEPQAQLAWQTVSMRDARDSGATYSYDRANSLRGRLGLRLVKLWDVGAEPERRFVSTWVRGNVWHEFLGDHDYRAAGRQGGIPVSFDSSLKGTWGEVELGVSGQVTKRITLFATAGYTRSLDSKGRRGWDGRLGASICW